MPADQPVPDVGERLWEPEHPYYCSESNYFMGGNDTPPFGHQEYRSWSHFLEAMDGADLDMNLVFRWDWNRGEDDDTSWLYLFYMNQRKGLYLVRSMPVTEANEPAVRAWLQIRLDHLLKLWAPLSPTTSPSDPPKEENDEDG